LNALATDKFRKWCDLHGACCHHPTPPGNSACTSPPPGKEVGR
jgi:hypothetical protein